jgi:hypothetical protein
MWCPPPQAFLAVHVTCPGEYAVDIDTRDTPQDAGAARPWGRAIKHADGMIHQESDQQGE